MRRRTFSWSLLLVFPAAVHAQQPAEINQRLEQIFARWDSTTTPGCAVAIGRPGQPTFARAFGMANLEHGIANTPATIFEAGSVSKQFTAAAIQLLAQEGKLSVDDDVRKYIPELPNYGKTITIQHMLNHTSGLRDWGSLMGIAGAPRGRRAYTHAHVVDILSRQRGVNFPSGQEYSYSNSGYNLLAVIVDRVSGMSFAEFSKKRLFEPIGMKNTQWRDDFTRIVKGRSVGYSAGRGGGSGYANDMPFENVHGNGGLLTTVGDLLIWNENLNSGKLGGPAWLTAMHRQGILTSGDTISYASGLQVGEYNGTREVDHTGSTAGYRAYLARHPEKGLSTAILCNAGNANPGTLGTQVAAIFLGTRTGGAGGGPRPAQPAEPWTPTAQQLQEFVGTYYSPDIETTFTVVLEDGRLFLKRRPDTRMALTPTTKDTFSGQLNVRFLRDASGAVTELSIRESRVYDLRATRQR